MRRTLSLTHYQYRDFIRANCTGQQRAMTAQAIAAETGISPRKQQELKADLLEAGVVICTSCAEPMGTYWPASEADKLTFTRQLEARRDALSAALGIIYASTPALRRKTLRTPPHTIRTTGAALDAQATLFGDGAA